MSKLLLTCEVKTSSKTVKQMLVFDGSVAEFIIQWRALEIRSREEGRIFRESRSMVVINSEPVTVDEAYDLGLAGVVV